MFGETLLREHSRLDVDLLRQSTEAQGISTGMTEEVARHPIQTGPGGALKPETLRRLAESSSAVRPAVETIKRTIAFMRWDIVLKDEEAEETDDIKARRDELRALFSQPNVNPFPFSNLLSMVLDDLLILDKYTIEVVKNRAGDKVVELWERDAATITPDIDEQGVWTGFTQKIPNKLGQTKKVIPFTPEQIIFCSMFPRSNRPTGTPIIETIINEVTSLLFMIQHIGVTFTEDEIPPGILWLGDGIAREVFARVTASLKQGRRRKFEDLKFRVYGGGQQAPKWVELKRANRDEQMRELRHDIEDIVFINFGVMPARMGRTDRVNRSNIEQQARWEESTLIRPIMKLLEFAVTLAVIERGYGYNDLAWRLIPDREETEESRAEVANKMLGPDIPVFTINGVRAKLYDEEPWDIIAANEPFIMTPTGPMFLKDMMPLADQPDDEGDDDGDTDGDDDDTQGPDGAGPEEGPDAEPADGDAAASVNGRRLPPAAVSMSVDAFLERAQSTQTVDVSNWHSMQSMAVFEQIRPMVEKQEIEGRRFLTTLTGTIFTAYSLTMLAAWNEARKNIADSLAAQTQLVGDNLIIADPQTRQEEMALVLAGMLTLFQQAAGEAFSMAGVVGRNAAQSIEAGAALTPRDLADLVREHELDNSTFLRNRLVRKVGTALWAVSRNTFDTSEAARDAARKAFDSQVYRLDRYARRVHSIGTDIYVRALDLTRKYRWRWWDVGDDVECSACVDAQARSPYANRGEMPFLPGQSPECNGNCRCEIEAEVLPT